MSERPWGGVFRGRKLDRDDAEPPPRAKPKADTKGGSAGDGEDPRSRPDPSPVYYRGDRGRGAWKPDRGRGRRGFAREEGNIGRYSDRGGHHSRSLGRGNGEPYGKEGRDYESRQSMDGKGFVDDSRLSKLIKRLLREEDRDRRLTLLRQMKDFIQQPENAKFISRSGESVLLSLQDIFYERGFKEIKNDVANCIGLLGFTMGSEVYRYVDWLFSTMAASQSDEIKINLLTALNQSLILDEGKNNMNELFPDILGQCQELLENADKPEMLVAVVDVILVVSRSYPHIYSSHFRDTVDILVGWHIDSTQRDSLTQYTSDALVSFHQFWVGDVNFSLTLLGQFVEDMEAYSEDLTLGLKGQQDAEDEMPTPQECVLKITALLKVFTTVVRSLGDFFHPDKVPTITVEYISKNLERVTKCVDSSAQSMMFERMLIAGNSCMELLVTQLGRPLVNVCDPLLAHLLRQLDSSLVHTNTYITSLLSLIHKVVEVLNTQLPIAFLTQMMGTTSMLHTLKFVQDKQVLHELVSVYQTILSLKSVPLLEEAYRHMLGDLQVSFNTLLDVTEADSQCRLVAANPFAELVYSSKQAEAAIVFDVVALSEIGNTKNNLIGMWALSPSIFELCANRLLPRYQSLMERYPTVQYSLLQALYSHCSRHNHFISSSHLISQSTKLEGSVLTNLSPSTGPHFSTILLLLAQLLTRSGTPYDSKRICMKWVQEITEGLQSSQHLYTTKPFLGLTDAVISLGYDLDLDVALGTCQVLQSLLTLTDKLPDSTLVRLSEMCESRLCDNSLITRQAFLDLLRTIPLASLAGSSRTVNSQSEYLACEQSRADIQRSTRRGHMARLPLGTFHTHCFRSVIGYILHNIPPCHVGSTSWLSRMYYSCQRADKNGSGTENTTSLGDLVEVSEGAQWFWACWEAAQFCVLAKLRTPLGKPQETFTTIEATLKQYAAEAKNRDLEDSSYKARTSPDGKDDTSSSNSHLRVLLLLQFLEFLEKHLYNAYEGCAVAMVNPPKVVRTFFRTNRATCQEWLMRIRLCVIVVASHTGQSAYVIRHTSQLLADLHEQGNTQDMEQVLVYAVAALIDLGCAEAVHGLYIWYKDITGKKLTWVKAASLMAAGKVESGLNELKSALRYYTTPESTLEDAKDTDSVGSANSSPGGSPRHGSLHDGMKKLSIMTRQERSSDSSSQDPIVAEFIVNQICEAYIGLGSWDEVVEWQETVQQYRTEHTGSPLQKAFSTDVDTNYYKALQQFEQLNFHTVSDLVQLVPGMSLDTMKDMSLTGLAWSARDVAHSAHRQFVKAITYSQTCENWRDTLSPIQQCLAQSQDWCEGLLHAHTLETPPALTDPTVMELLAATATSNQLAQTAKIKGWMLPLGQHTRFSGTLHTLYPALHALQTCRLQHYLQHHINPTKPADFSGHLSSLRLAAVQLARKQQNLMTAEQLLLEEVVFHWPGVCGDTAGSGDGGSEMDTPSLWEALTRLRTQPQTGNMVHTMRVEREGIKLLHVSGQPREAVELLVASVEQHAVGLVTLGSASRRDTLHTASDLNARSLLNLVQWLQIDSKNLVQLTAGVKLLLQSSEENETVSSVSRHLYNLLKMEELGARERKGVVLDADSDEDLNISNNPILSDTDGIVGRLLHLATMQVAPPSKAWFALAGWCYKWGRKAVDLASHGSVQLSTEEKAQVVELLPRGTSLEETDAVLTVLSQVHAGVGSEEDISDQDESMYDEGLESTRRQLLGCCLSLQIASDHCVDRLIEVWRSVVRRVYHYYQVAAKAYFSFLKLTGQCPTDNVSVDNQVTATLRLLRLLVKHAWELRGVLETGLALTLTAPWKGIIPQLFSRLNHPEPYVRQSVSDLLCRMAQDTPHLIVYPAVVGCSNRKHCSKDGNRDGLLNEYLSQSDDENSEPAELPSQADDDLDVVAEDSNTDLLQNCFTAIVETLANKDPNMISEVQRLVGELRRVTLLWDELWLGTLNQQHSDVTRRLTQLDHEVKKVMNNTSLSKEDKQLIIREKHRTVMKPTVYTIEQLLEISSGVAETPHEEWFQATYLEHIRSALTQLKEPTNPSHPHSSWQPFKQLHHSLQQRAQKRTSLLLAMDQISPTLHRLRSTVIAMPGVSADIHPITIHAIQPAVHILPTKTKPKKLVFVGSDGKKYAYLFKGLEDLHLDERIMQFLAIVNNMFAKSNRGGQRLYHARHYSVTPLGARSGLIQWVDGATPLFSLYKRWQQREAVAQQLKQQQQQGSTAATSTMPAIPRPSEVFYSKLTPALKDKGITNLDSRKEWPSGVLRKVLEELMADTPADLLARELWCSSTGPREWWQVTQMYSRSTAVMSMIGYIIGLGDRHLDNVLVDLATGEVVHIDYNVCFEKGRGLRVPEKVPFRMTPNLKTALGVTGIEGIFRQSCEHVMRTMRRGRETLLTLLEAFVYDPLVDWTTGGEAGYTGAFYGGDRSVAGGQEVIQSKKDMERDITNSMFSIRMAEMKTAWLTNREEMLSCLPQLQKAVGGQLGTETALQATQDRLHLTHTLLDTYLQQDSTDHPTATLPLRWCEFAAANTQKVEVMGEVETLLNDSERFHKTHTGALAALHGSILQQMVSEVNKPLSNCLASFDPVVDFLQTAGQGQLISQCEQVSGELAGMVHQRRLTVNSCLDVLHTYTSICGQYPSSFVDQHRNIRQQQLLQEVICDFTSQKCGSVAAIYEAEFCAGPSDTAIRDVIATESRLQNHCSLFNDKLMKIAQRRSQESVESTLLTAHSQNTTAAVSLFMQEHGTAGVACMTSVVVSALCSLCKRYLVMEGAAATAGERLMDLTSREGDWFLDELCSMSGNVNQLLPLLSHPTLVPLLSPSISQQVQQAMQSTHAVYAALQDLNTNFRTIIVPEALRTLQRGDPSVGVMVGELGAMVTSTGVSLEMLISQLERQLINIIMGMDVLDEDVVSKVKVMRLKFDQLQQQQTGEEPGELSPGQMLLMGLHGLFTRLDTDFSAMLDTVSRVAVPDVWRKVDVVKEARALQMTAFNESTMALLSNVFFLKELKAIQDFFQLAHQAATSLNGGGGACPDEEDLAGPIKYFIAEYIRKHVIGLPSQTLGYVLCLYVNSLHVDVTAEIELRDIGAESKVSLEELCKKAVDMGLKNGLFEHVQLTQASSLVSTADLAWRKSDLALRLDKHLPLLKACAARAAQQLARYQWLHEDCLLAGGWTPQQVGGWTSQQAGAPSRTTLLTQLAKMLQALVPQESAVQSVQQRHLQLESSIVQRLKWAAGANPILGSTLQQFEAALAANTDLVQGECVVAGELVAIMEGLLHLETLRTRTPEALASDTNFLQLIKRCEETSVMLEGCGSSVTELEQLLLEIKPLPEGVSVTEEWLEAARDAVQEAADQLTATLADKTTGNCTAKESVKGEVSSIRGVLTTHHKLMSDVRSILKSLAKQEEQDHGSTVAEGGVREYVNLYKNFSENFTTMLKLVMTEDLSTAVVADIDFMIDDLSRQIVIIYDDLLQFAPPLAAAVTPETPPDLPPVSFASALKGEGGTLAMRKMGAQAELLTGTSSATHSPPMAAPTPSKVSTPIVKKVEKVTRDPRTGKAVQERNSYAVSVWRRVKMKLDGRDPDINKRLSVQEQVDYVIQEAVGVDNLAVLYEGWTPWV